MVVSWVKGPSSSPSNQGVRGPQAGCFGSWFLLGVVVDCSGALSMPTAAVLSPSPLGLRFLSRREGCWAGSEVWAYPTLGEGCCTPQRGGDTKGCQTSLQQGRKKREATSPWLSILGRG